MLGLVALQVGCRHTKVIPLGSKRRSTGHSVTADMYISNTAKPPDGLAAQADPRGSPRTLRKHRGVGVYLAVNDTLRYTDAVRSSTGVTMSTDVAEIETKIRSLSLEDKTELIRALIAELDGPADGDVERAWLHEAQRRYREVVEGKVQPVPGERVFENPRARLKR